VRVEKLKIRHRPVADFHRREASRRGFLLAGAIMVGGAAVLAPRPAASAAKMPKTQAGYKDAPRGPQRCDKCLQFQPPSACKLVDGAVSPSGSCNLFAPRPS